MYLQILTLPINHKGDEMMKIKKNLTVVIMLGLIVCIFASFEPFMVDAETSDFENEYSDMYVYQRNSEYYVDDDGRFNQPLDRITSSDYTYTPLELKNSFTYVTVEIRIYIKEINDGYQYVFLYNGVEDTSTLLAAQQLEHGHGEALTSYKTYNLTFSNIPLDDFSNNDIVIRYGASGSYSDNWVNKNISVILKYSLKRTMNFTEIKTSSDYIYTRDAEYSIDDLGRFKQPLGRITTSDFEFAPLDMKESYMYVTITLKIDIKEIADGYQIFYLYNGVEGYNRLLAEKQIEHYPGVLNTTYKTYTITFDSIPLDLFESNDIVIKYGASGIDEDDWKNRNVKVSIEYLNSNTQLSLNIKYSEYLNAGETKTFSFYIPDNMYYVVETRGDKDTYLTIEGLSISPLNDDDDDGVKNNACIGFAGEIGWITIKLRFFSPSTSGTTELQIRKQQAVLYGFEYSGKDKIDTTPDIEQPYLDLRDTYQAYRFTQENSSQILSNDSRGYSRLNSEIVFFSGHGYVGGVWFINDMLDSVELTNMENTKVAVWAACYSSSPGEGAKSMTQASVDAGAKASVGWPVRTATFSSKAFTNELFSRLSSGYTIEDVCEKASDKITLPFDNIHKWQIAGDKTTTIGYNIINKLMSSSTLDFNVLNDFQNRYKSTNEWAIYELNNETRIYRTINGYITNDYYTIKKQNENIIDIEHSGIFVDNINTLAILNSGAMIKTNISVDSIDFTISNMRTYIVYNKIGTVLVPIEVKYCEYESLDGFGYEEVVCTNLNNGLEVDYSDYFIRK